MKEKLTPPDTNELVSAVESEFSGSSQWPFWCSFITLTRKRECAYVFFKECIGVYQAGQKVRSGLSERC